VERLIWEHVIQHGRFDLDVETPLDLTQMAPRDTTVGRTPFCDIACAECQTLYV
jgi:hypothetical protein